MSDTEQLARAASVVRSDSMSYRLKKTPSRSWLRGCYGPGYMVVEYYSNTVVLGCVERGYGDARRGRGVDAGPSIERGSSDGIAV